MQGNLGSEIDVEAELGLKQAPHKGARTPQSAKLWPYHYIVH